MRVLKFDGAIAPRVLKFDALPARGLWIALRAILIKTALRDDLAVSYGMISILLNYLPSADTPPIRLRRTSPASGGRIKHRETLSS